MELATLTIFVEVMRRRSFAAVARAQGVTPSSISRCIANLEEELGVRLFHRSTRSLEPTEAGMIYFERISPAVAELESAVQLVTDVNKEVKGTLRVTAATVYGEIAIVPLLPRLAATYPQLSIELLLTDTYLNLVEERIDVAIRLGTLQDSAYIAKRVCDMTFHVCASPEYLQRFGKPAAITEIENHECLLFPRGNNLDWRFKHNKDGQVSRIAINGKYLITNSRAIRQCAIAGMGLALLPDWLVDDDIAAGRLVVLFPDYAADDESAIWILYPSREYLPLKSRVFIDFLTESIQNKYAEI